MKVYKVGGAVRDKLLGKTPHDNDYIVVGATPEDMLAMGYSQVGKDFPVFLHPKTSEEYALARMERKTGPKHTDFVTDFHASVTIEEDLRRRDLTINAIAVPHNFEGDIVDPFNGMQDLKDGVLRHVSEAFREDPLRVLRLARFSCKFPTFKIAEETKQLAREMVYSGELDHLTKERVFEETKKAFLMDNSHIYLSTLLEFGAIGVLGDHVYINETNFFEAFERLDFYGRWLDDDDRVMMKFALLFMGNGMADFSERHADAKKLKIPSHYIQFLNDYGNIQEMLMNFDNAELALKYFNKINIESRMMRDPEHLNLLVLLETIYTLGTSICKPENIRTIFREVGKYKEELKFYIELTTEVEGLAPEGKKIGKAAQVLKLKHMTNVLKGLR